MPRPGGGACRWTRRTRTASGRSRATGPALAAGVAAVHRRGSARRLPLAGHCLTQERSRLPRLAHGVGQRLRRDTRIAGIYDLGGDRYAVSAGGDDLVRIAGSDASAGQQWQMNFRLDPANDGWTEW